MKRNKHIGLTHYFWLFMGLIALFVYMFFFDNVIMALALQNDFKLFRNDNGQSLLDRDDIAYLISYQWDSILSFCFVVTLIFLLIEKFVYPFLQKRIQNRLEDLESYVMAGLIVFLFYKVLLVNTKALYRFKFEVSDSDTATVFVIASVIVAIVIFFAKMLAPIGVFEWVSDFYLKILKIKGNSIFRRLFIIGFGGSARWADILQYKKLKSDIEPSNEERPRGFVSKHPILGKSLFDDDPHPRLISIKDDAHLITIGMTGAGKSTTVLFPNLALYYGSAFIYDPKGELALNTFWRRHNYEYLEDYEEGFESNVKYRHYIGKSKLLDPFKETKDALPYSSYNPLAEIDIKDERGLELVRAISDGCVITDGEEKSQHWNDWAKNMIEALIVHVLSRYPEENHNLPFVLDLFSGQAPFYYTVPEGENDLSPFEELLVDMMTNDACGGLPQQVATHISNMSENERGSVYSTTYRALKWAGDPAMRKHLKTSNFEVSTLIGYPVTVYIVLPDSLVSAQAQWVRVLVGVFLILERRKPLEDRSDVPTLFILDEFKQLGGKIDAVVKGFPILRGYKIKLWLFFQNLSQIKDAVGGSWTDLISASTIQVFGVNDPVTADWITERIGERTSKTKKKRKWYKSGEVVRETNVPLIATSDVYKELGKESRYQIVFSTSGYPMRLERLSYKAIEGKEYKPIPIKQVDLQGHFEDF